MVLAQVSHSSTESGLRTVLRGRSQHEVWELFIREVGPWTEPYPPPEASL